jgi:hypothetical protein
MKKFTNRLTLCVAYHRQNYTFDKSPWLAIGQYPQHTLVTALDSNILIALISSYFPTRRTNTGLFYYFFIYDLKFKYIIALHAAKSRVRFPRGSLKFFTDFVLPAELWP